MPSFSIQPFSTFFVILFAFTFAIKFVLLSQGEVLNHYPFLSDDAYDWYTEGIYLVEMFNFRPLEPLPNLRPPVFLIFTALDFLMGSMGLVLGSLFGLCIFFNYWISIRIVKIIYSFKLNTNLVDINATQKMNLEAWYSVPIAIGFTLYPINFIRVYILAEPLAITLALFSIYLFIKYLKFNNSRTLFYGAILASIAGLTQAYGLLPFLLSCCFALVGMNIKNNKAPYIFSICTTLFCYLSVTIAWRWSIPHLGTPINFELLKVSMGMLHFYEKTWGFFIIPLLLVFILFSKQGILRSAHKPFLFLFLFITIIFAFLAFFYQQYDSRFTFLLYPWLLIFLCLLTNINAQWRLFGIALTLFFLSGISPKDYWLPSWRNASISLLQNWIGNYFLYPISPKSDKGFSNCSQDCIQDNFFIQHSNNYVRDTLILYQKLVRPEKNSESK